MRELTDNPEGLYGYYMKHLAKKAPYFHPTTKKLWEKSMYEDVDFEGIAKFKHLFTLVAKDESRILGFIQFGISSYCYDESGEKDFSQSIAVIRQIYYSKNEQNVGQELLNKALTYFESQGYSHYYAFFHAFGMSFTSSHGKLFQDFDYIEALLLDNGLQVEHENVYYKKNIERTNIVETEIRLKYELDSNYHTELVTFCLDGQVIGHGNIFYLPDGKRVYLRWIYLNDDFQNKGYGSRIMDVLCNYLHEKDITEIHTDTADSNYRAQYYYKKNGFENLGRTRSYLI